MLQAKLDARTVVVLAIVSPIVPSWRRYRTSKHRTSVARITWLLALPTGREPVVEEDDGVESGFKLFALCSFIEKKLFSLGRTMALSLSVNAVCQKLSLALLIYWCVLTVVMKINDMPINAFMMHTAVY